MLASLVAGCQSPTDRSDPPAPIEGSTEVDWDVNGAETPWHGRVFVAVLPAPAPAEVRCVADDDPEEAFYLESPVDTVHEIEVLGLLADTAYTCTASALGTDTEIGFRTEPPPDWIPSWEVSGEPPWGSYFLLNHGLGADADNEEKMLIIDRDGGLRWSMLAPKAVPDLDAQYLDDGTILFGGGHGIVPTRVDLFRTTQWEAPPSSTGLGYHHHTEWLPTDEILTLAHAGNTDGVEAWGGFTVEVIDVATSTRPWVWNSQQAVDAGSLPPPVLGDEDPYHANAVQRLEDGDMLVSLYGQGHVIRVDADTGEIVWKLGPGGDFALVDETGAPVDEAEWFYRSHSPKLLDGRVLLYDNGTFRPGGAYSRAVEIEIDEELRTARVVWSWTEPGWFEPIWGDVDRLPNGNVLVTKAHCGFCELDEAGRTEIVEVDREQGAVWRLTFADPEDAGYRAQAIDGCAIFANERYCDDVR